MTREELFAAFPRPWRLSAGELGVVQCADGSEALTIDTIAKRSDLDAMALAALVVDLVNAAEG
jgi:hypothetical protein